MTHSSILYCKAFESTIVDLSEKYRFQIQKVENSERIPGSFWGDDEAGLIGNNLFIKELTPLHSAFHEICHYICMDSNRRKNLYRDAKSSIIEENGVCYLQILLSKYYSPIGEKRMQHDMDKWGYSFRFGSAKAWFENDASDAFDWLYRHKIIYKSGRLTWNLRKN
tara:strand:+ start:1409 stop:1906 length:498 start_codon:yes stop_codon:yes gene_type:complete